VTRLRRGTLKDAPMILARRLFLALAAFATALIAGFFYTYSISVMPGLEAADPAAAIQAMQGINAVIRTPVFAFAFFGSFAFPIVAAALSRQWSVGLPLIGAAIVYGAGCLALTFFVHVPMNDALAVVSATPADAPAIWRGYAGPWTAWNHLRAIASALSFGLVAAAVVNEWRSLS
jgi:uncharacterized membrane protein